MVGGKILERLKRGAALAVNSPSVFAHRLYINIYPSFLVPEKGETSLHGVRFPIDRSLDEAMKAMYLRSYQTEITGLLDRYLKPGDTFIDVGANVGYISAYGLGRVGKSGKVFSFEPVPRYFELLQKIREMNPEYALNVNNMAAGDQEDTAKIAVTNLKNIGWNTMVPGFMKEGTVKEEISVRVVRLDEYLPQQGAGNIKVIKIDVEGFEFPVIKGLSGILENKDQAPVVAVELNPTAYSRLGLKIEDLFAMMKKWGYTCWNQSMSKVIHTDDLEGITDVVFVKVT